MDTEVTKILISDDHALLRAGLKKIFRDEADFLVSHEAGNAFETIDIVRKEDIDFVILDLNMPGGGIDVIKDLKQIKPKLQILVLSMHPEDRFAVRAIRAGASGYLTKESAPELLVSAIRRIVSGGRYISDSLAEKLADQLTDNTSDVPHKKLSDREHQIFLKISSGKKVTEIAKELNISVPTVNTYRARILEKMKLKSNVELTQYAMHNKLID